MKHLLLLLLCLFLTGCGSEKSEPTVPETAPAETLPQSLYDPGSAMEAQTGGAVLAYPLPMEDVTGMRAMGTKILLFSGEMRTSLWVLSGEEGRVEARLDLRCSLDPKDPSVNVGSHGLSYFDRSRRETVVLDENLTELNAIAAPGDMVGSPILSADGKTLYYCTSSAIRGWDLRSGVRRLIKELPDPGRLTGLHWGDTLLQCTQNGKTLLISAEDGRQLWEGDENFTLRTLGGRYYACVPTGMRTDPVFGTQGEDPRVLTTEDLSGVEFLESIHGAVTQDLDADGRQTLRFYDLASGLCSSLLGLGGQVEDMGGYVYVLSSGVLYRWDVHNFPSGDEIIYVSEYGSSWLDECRAYADDIASRHGIQVLIGREAAGAAPWDYDFDYEPLAAPTWRQLELLDEALSNFPRELLDKAAEPFGGLTICLVRSITGTPESGSVGTANGIQFRDDSGACLALAMGPHSVQTLYHELFHVMETKLLVESTAFDQWENLNPKGFAYPNSYDAPLSQQELDYCRGEDRYFIDRYSMSFPKEDRARIMEYAMTPGNAELFRSPTLQAKLNALCVGIRETFGLKKSPENFLWEQYLAKSLAHEN